MKKISLNSKLLFNLLYYFSFYVKYAVYPLTKKYLYFHKINFHHSIVQGLSIIFQIGTNYLINYKAPLLAIPC